MGDSPGNAAFSSAGGHAPRCPEDCRRTEHGYARFADVRLGPPPPGYHPVRFLDSQPKVGAGRPPGCPGRPEGSFPGTPSEPFSPRPLLVGGRPLAQRRPGSRGEGTHHARRPSRQQVGGVVSQPLGGWSGPPSCVPMDGRRLGDPPLCTCLSFPLGVRPQSPRARPQAAEQSQSLVGCLGQEPGALGSGRVAPAVSSGRHSWKRRERAAHPPGLAGAAGAFRARGGQCLGSGDPAVTPGAAEFVFRG